MVLTCLIRLSALAPVVRIPVGLRFELVVEVYVLGLAELFDAFRAEFAPAARKAHAAEGAGGGVRERVVDPEGSGLDALGGGQGVLKAVGQDLRAEAVFGLVGERDRFVN